jgi:hypothetical protein
MVSKWVHLSDVNLISSPGVYNKRLGPVRRPAKDIEPIDLLRG